MSEIVVKLHQCVASGEFDLGILNCLGADDVFLQECEVLDYKQQLPTNDFEYAKTVRDLVAMHNSYGGFLIFGIRETEKDRGFRLVGVEQNIQLNKLRDMTLNYLGTDLRISASTKTIDGLSIEIIWVAKRANGDKPLKFKKKWSGRISRKAMF